MGPAKGGEGEITASLSLLLPPLSLSLFLLLFFFLCFFLFLLFFLFFLYLSPYIFENVIFRRYNKDRVDELSIYPNCKENLSTA
jgi:hypothetical protein